MIYVHTYNEHVQIGRIRALVRAGQRQRQRDRETDTERERQKDRLTDRHSETRPDLNSPCYTGCSQTASTEFRKRKKQPTTTIPSGMATVTK